MLKDKLNLRLPLLCFLVSSVVSALFIIPVMAANGGAFTLGTDFNFQQITFMDSAKSHIISGTVWADNFGIGGDIFNLLGFYNILSPFSIIYYLIPGDTNYIYFVGIFAILKFGVMGLSSAMYFKRYLKEWQNVLFASLLFVFSGTVFFNMNYHFLDSYALIPLLFWALDCAVLDRKKGWFAISAAALLMTNYMFFYSTVIFLVIYFVAKLITKEYIVDIKTFLRLSLESVVSILLASTVLFRAILPTFLNPRFLGQTIDVATSAFSYDSYTLATIIRGVLLPAESLNYRAFFLDRHPDIPSLWLPVVGVVLVFAYLVRCKDKFARILLGISFVMAAIPILNAVFSLSLNHYYPRWFILPLMFMALYSAKFFEIKKRISPVWGLIPVIICAVALAFFSTIWEKVVTEPTVSHFFQNVEKATLYIVIAGISLILTIAACYLKSRKIAVLVLSGAVVIVSTVLGTINMDSLQLGFGNYPQHASVESYFIDSYNTLVDDDSYVRYDNNRSYANLSVLTDKPSVNLFSSTLHQTSYEIREIIGEVQDVTFQIDHNQNYGFQTFTSVKYIIRAKSHANDVYLPGYTEIFNTEYFTVYEYPYYIPMGFTFDSYITSEQLNEVNQADRDLLLLKSLYIDDDVKNILPAADVSDYDFSFESFEADVIDRKSETADVFYEIKNGFYSEITLESDNIVFYSIPYDEGFSATVNGEAAEIYKVQGGFIGIAANAGENTIEFVYTPKTLVLEIVLMMIGVMTLIIYIFYDRIKKRVFNGKDRE